MTKNTIRDILAGRPLYCVEKSFTLRDIAISMSNNNVGAVAVTSEGKLVGVLTERDIVFRGIGQGWSMDDATAEDVMTRDPITVQSDDPISDALAVNLGNRFRHLPVMENGAVVGIISFRDIPAEYVMMFERFREMSSSSAHEY